MPERVWRMLIGGELVEAIGGGRYAVQNPTDEQVLAHVPDAGAGIHQLRSPVDHQ